MTEKFAGKTWQRIAQDRQLWKELGKAYVQQWTDDDDDDDDDDGYDTKCTLCSLFLHLDTSLWDARAHQDITQSAPMRLGTPLETTVVN